VNPSGSAAEPLVAVATSMFPLVALHRTEKEMVLVLPDRTVTD
jgi:hypothetical protein